MRPPKCERERFLPSHARPVASRASARGCYKPHVVPTYLQVACVLLVVIPSLSVHEASHAWTADRLGDPTARSLGRVTLNPLVHLDLFLSVILPIATWLAFQAPLAAAKPVPVNMRRLRHPRRDWALVALAGPGSNVALALLAAALLWALRSAGLSEPDLLGDRVLRLGVVVNVLLAVFNLIPIPALDGSRVVGYLLPPNVAGKWYEMDRYGFWILVGLLLLPRLFPGFNPLGDVVGYGMTRVLGFFERIVGFPILKDLDG